jgi:hypothetical protein
MNMSDSKDKPKKEAKKPPMTGGGVNDKKDPVTNELKKQELAKKLRHKDLNQPGPPNVGANPKGGAPHKGGKTVKGSNWEKGKSPAPPKKGSDNPEGGKGKGAPGRHNS